MYVVLFFKSRTTPPRLEDGVPMEIRMSIFPTPLPLACGLAFDIEKASTKSGFQPARFDLGAGKELFADLRLDGFASLLKLGFAQKLIIFGGNEGRYKDEGPIINRGWAITEMLIHDFDIPTERLDFVASNSNTGGNIEAIRDSVGKRESVVVSNHYHAPRAALDLVAAGLLMPFYSAEAFWLLENPDGKEVLVERLGGNPYAERTVEEIQGIAHKLKGTYNPRTDIAPLKRRWWHKVRT
jgi:hypothetical protein